MASTPATTNSETALHRNLEEVLLKVESRTAAGEFTPNTDASGFSSHVASIIDEKSDVEKGETTRPNNGAITHRPTGIRV
jgi:hypothetical protein